MPIIDVRDWFNGGSGDLAGRVPDMVARTEYSWANSSGRGVVNQIGASGWIEYNYAGGVGNLICYTVGGPRSPNYRVFSNAQHIGLQGTGVVSRWVSNSECYRLMHYEDGDMLLFKGDSIVRTTNVGAAGSNVNHSIQLEVIGTGPVIVYSYFNNVLWDVWNDVSSPFTQIGRAGISGDAHASSGCTGRWFDFEVIDLTNPVRMII